MVFSGRLARIEVPPTVESGKTFNVKTTWQNTSAAGGTCGLTILVDGNIATIEVIALGGLEFRKDVITPVTIGAGAHSIKVETDCSLGDNVTQTVFLVEATGETEVIFIPPEDVLVSKPLSNGVEVYILICSGSTDAELDTFILNHSFGVDGAKVLEVKPPQLYNVGRTDCSNGVPATISQNSFLQLFQKTLDSAIRFLGEAPIEFTTVVSDGDKPTAPFPFAEFGGLGIGVLIIAAFVLFAGRRKR